jgi:trehalose/maltose hydrolase-like predicted phosphorylase
MKSKRPARRAGPRRAGAARLGAAAILLALGAHGAAAETDPSFLLTATLKDLPSYFPGYLANGYVSALTTPRGVDDSLGYMVALMDRSAGDIARPAAIPAWTGIDYSAGVSPTGGRAWLNRAELVPARFQDYAQTLNLREATLETRYRYLDGARATAVAVTTFISQASPHLALTRMTIIPAFDGVVELAFTLDTWAPHQPRFPLASLSGPAFEEALAANNLTIAPIPPATPAAAPVWYHGDVETLARDGDPSALTLWLDGQAAAGSAVAEAIAIGLPEGVNPLSARFSRTAYRMTLTLSVQVEAGRTYAFTKYAALSRAGWGGDARADVALAQAARDTGFEALLAAHRAAWRGLWVSDILIDGDPAAQRAIHSELYHLLASSTADTAWPLAACGLTPGYFGHAFWDGDTWIFPALLLLQPDRARSLATFRERTLPAAQDRARGYGYQGAMYPWESDAENGTEQIPHFAGVLSDHEIHVDADVAIAQWQYYLASGDVDWLRQRGWPVIRAVADFWTSRATPRPGGDGYDIAHVTSVSENHSDVLDDTFTDASARKALRIAIRAAALVGEAPDPRWARVAAGLVLPLAAEGDHHLDFDASTPLDPGEATGMTLPMLALPSLDLAMSPSLRRGDDLYAKPFGPRDDPNSMGLGPSAITAATLGDAEGAYMRFQRNLTGGTLKPPFNVRTETPGNNAGYFMTASGGFLQTLLYGFSGLRLEEAGLVQAYPPLLPANWRSLTLKAIAVRGQRYDIVIDRDAAGKVQLTRRPAATAPRTP